MRRPSRTWSAIASGSGSPGTPSRPPTSRASSGQGCPIADRVARRHGSPTEFELLTALAFRHFADAGVDLAIVEVGLGGRLDATHAWDGGVAAITNVDLDHTEHLGATVELIAREKAAIVMRGDRAVTGAAGPALGPIRRRARRVGVSLVEVSPAPVLAFDRRGLVVELPGLGAVRVGLLGRHQAANVAVADAVLDALGAAGIAHVSSEIAARRLRRGALAGTDGAARPARGRTAGRRRAGPPRRGAQPGRRSRARRGARRAAARAPGLRGPAVTRGATPVAARSGARSAAPVTLVIGTMADKDVDGLVAALGTSRSLAGARVIATAVPGARAMPPGALAARWQAAVPGIGCRGRRGSRRPRSTGRSRPPRAPSSWRGRSTSWARPEHASWTTRAPRSGRRDPGVGSRRDATPPGPGRPEARARGGSRRGARPAPRARRRPARPGARRRRGDPVLRGSARFLRWHARPRRRRSRSVPGRSPGAAGPS